MAVVQPHIRACRIPEAGSSDSVGGSCGQALGKCSEIMSHPRQAIIFKSGELKRRQ